MISAGLLEVYLRRTQTYVLDQRGPANRQARRWIANTPNGPRLVPSSRVLIRNHRLSHRNIPLRVNSRGLRGPEIAMPKPSGTRRIFVLGDSITLGDYVLERETYVRRLEAHLRSSIGANVEVVNGGMNDVGLREQIAMLREAALDLDVDWVVLGFYLNDSRPSSGFSGEVGARGWLRQRLVTVDLLYRSFRLDRWLARQGVERFAWIEAAKRADWTFDEAAFHRLADLARYDWGAAWQPDSWKVVENGFAELQDLGRKHGFRIAIVSFPVRYQVETTFVDDTPQRKAEALSTKLGFPYLDLLPLLRAQPYDLFYDQCHLRPEANDRVGGAIADFLRDRL